MFSEHLYYLKKIFFPTPNRKKIGLNGVVRLTKDPMKKRTQIYFCSIKFNRTQIKSQIYVELFRSNPHYLKIQINSMSLMGLFFN
jgi:hypothetical protein